MIRPSDADIAAYHRDGVLLVRGLLGPSELETAKSGIERVLADAGQLAQVASTDDDPGRFGEDCRRWTDIDEIGELAVGERVAGDAVHAPRRWTTSPPFDELIGVVPDGASLDHPLFPTV